VSIWTSGLMRERMRALVRIDNQNKRFRFLDRRSGTRQNHAFFNKLPISKKKLDGRKEMTHSALLINE
ncbi:MAG: hypothetical protein ABIR29_09250, partial [Chthoniobacterales bacterium]